MLVVAASAGAGKTTAVLQAARALPGPAAWIPLGGLATGDIASEALRGRLARAVPATGTGSLVVDGLEHIAGRAAAEDALSALVLQPPPRLRLVLVTRADPPEGIAGLGDVHRVAFLDDADLAFDVSEAARALRPAGLEEQAHFRVRAPARRGCPVPVGRVRPASLTPVTRSDRTDPRNRHDARARPRRTGPALP